MAERRVRRPRDKDDLIKRLVEDVRPFETYRDVLAFAAALGYARESRVPFEQSGEQISWEQFGNRPGLEALVNMLAAADGDDFNILANDRFDERLRTFEEYANGGLIVLEDELRRPGLPLDIVLRLMLEAEGATSTGQTLRLDELSTALTW